MELQIAIDADRCELVAYCTQIAPKAFDTTSGGVARVRVRTVGNAQLGDAVREAAATCPTGAISVIVEGGNADDYA